MSLRRNLLVPVAAVLLSILSVSTSHAGAVVLAWTVPGDDSLTGQAAHYDLRYSQGMITTSNFASATIAAGVGLPGAPGTVQSVGITNLTSGMTYYFAIKTQDKAGNWSIMSNVVTKVATDTADAPDVLGLSFSVPQPNPSREATNFAYSLPVAGQVKVDVFDVAGRHVRTLADEQHAPGAGTLRFDLRDDQGVKLAAGVYMVRAQIASTSFSRRVIVTP